MGVEVDLKSIEQNVRLLTKQFALSPATAHSLLWNEIQQLEQVARIRDCIPLLALKPVKEQLQEWPLLDSSYGLA
ncbi:MAG: DUF3562 domain-containing protein [Nitrospira sp.]|nr:hypothetical protein [Nitrospira sp.]